MKNSVMSSIPNKILVAPKRFRANNIFGFLAASEVIFRSVKKNRKGFLLDVSQVQECSMLGLLLVYKVIDFFIKNDCFENPKYKGGNTFDEEIEKYGFREIMRTYISGKGPTENRLKRLKVSIVGDFIIAPKALLRNDKYGTEFLNKKYLPKISDYYRENEKAVKMIFICFSEILLNFWEHAVEDTESIIAAYGNKNYIEIACADNGKGVLTTLSLSGKSKKTNEATLSSAVQKGVTSKELTNHMGYGLYIIDQVAKLTNGKFHIYSEGYYYQREHKKEFMGKCGFWKGTVVYLRIPLNKPVSLSDIENLENKSFDGLRINWK